MREADYYAPGSYNDTAAPWNQEDIPEEKFEVTCSQSLSRTATVWTNNYTPGASGVDYEPDGEGGYCASSWHDDPDTSDTNWGDEYSKCGYMTPLQLIQLFKEELEKQFNECNEATSEGKLQAKKLKYLIEECDCWTEDETEYIVEN